MVAYALIQAVLALVLVLALAGLLALAFSGPRRGDRPSRG